MTTITNGMINKAAKNPPTAPVAEPPLVYPLLEVLELEGELEELDLDELEELDFELLLEELDEWLVLWPTAASTTLT